MMLLYVGVEFGIAAWLTTYMIELHGTTPAAARARRPPSGPRSSLAGSLPPASPGGGASGECYSLA